VIRALARGLGGRRRDSRKVTRQKRDALFDLACRIAVLADKARGSPSSLQRAAGAEKRKSLRSALALVAAGVDAEGLERGLGDLLAEADPGSRLELDLVVAGLRGILSGEHYSIVMRRMAAFLGPEYFDKATDWLAEKARRRRQRSETLVVPGDMPDVVRVLAIEPRCLETAMRAAGRSVSTAALAGCPQESVDLAKRYFDRIGASALEEDAAYLRSRLSGDEISEAQTAFLEVVRSLEERGEIKLGEEDELGTDEAFVAAFTKAVLEVGPSAIRAAIKTAEGPLVATAMQGLEPAAHDHILSALPKKETKRILDAIDEADPLPRRAIVGAGRELAARLIAALSRTQSPQRVLDGLAAVRDWAIQG
jgi:hypothetical protein